MNDLIIGGMTMKQEPHHCGEGIQRTYKFKNGTKLSVVKTPWTYGGKDDLWEIAVLDTEGNFITREVWYDTYDDVIGHVTDSQLQSYISDVHLHDLED